MLSASVRRWLFWFPLILGLALVLVWLLRPRPVAVDFATIARGPLRVTVSDEGRTRVRDVFVVSAPLAGFMHRIELESGDEVIARKTVVARITRGDPAFLDLRSQTEARAAVRAAEAAHGVAAASTERAQAEQDFADSDLQRVRGLAARNSISQAELDAAERRAKTAAASLREAQAGRDMRASQLEQARARLLEPGSTRRQDAQVAVFSPVSGRVLRVLQESEGIVGAGTALIEVGDPRALEIVVDLLSTEAVRVVAGQRAIIEFWGGPQPLEGKVRRVEPFGFTKVSALGVEEQRVNVIIDITSAPQEWQRLGHGYRVEPLIVLWESADVLKIPLAALFRDGQYWAAFVVEDGRATLRHLTLGAENNLEAEVLDGVQAGDRVVLHPGDRVDAGVRLALR
jgi:HlyD family secretion protein